MPSTPEMFTARADLGLAWSVKDTFLQYIRGMRDGNIGWDSGAAVTSTGEFFFPLADVRATDDSAILSFRGTVVFTAHHGLLAVRISHPRITIRDGIAELSLGAAEAPAAAATAEATETVASIALSPRIHDGDVTMWLNCAVSLAGVGPELFGGTYPGGEPLAPLTVRVPTVSLAPANREEKSRVR